MKKTRTFAMYVGGAVVGILAGGGIGLVATASTDSSKLISEEGIQSEWNRVTSQSDLRFPEGSSFSTDPPQFFQTIDPKADNVFDPLLFESLANQEWRCAWLGEALEGGAAARGVDIEITQQLDSYESLLPKASAKEFAQYQATLDEVAVREGTTSEALEYTNDCGGFQ